VSTEAPISVWQSLSEKLVFQGDGLPQVRRQLAWYREQGSLLDEASVRATPYLFYVMEEIEARGFPADLALLPIVESGYEPTVISRHGAAGLWQFMGGTGRRFGLSRSGWVDERLDITASTTAALDYLGTLSRRFDGDWLLAIAAYNSGWGNVERAIARNRRAGRPTDVWHLPLRGETHALIARVVALSEIYRNPGAHGLTLPAAANEPYFARVVLAHPTDLREFARRSGIDEKLFKRLNPGLRGWQTTATQNGCFQRVRYTGTAARMPIGLAATKQGLRVDFTCELDAQAATDAANWNLELWNYVWSSAYGSPEISTTETKVAATELGNDGRLQFSKAQMAERKHDVMVVRKATLSADKRSVLLEVADLRPAMQAQLKYDVKSADGAELRGQVTGTIHALAE